MRVWLPYVAGGSGTDTFTASLAKTLTEMGHRVTVQRFSHTLQYVPHLARGVSPPPGTDISLTNSWNGFAFERPGIPMVTMVQLSVHDPVSAEFRSYSQGIFHRRFVHGFERKSFDSASAVVVVSRATQLAVEQAFPGVESTVIPNGVDADFFVPPRARARDPDEPFRLLFVGNLTRRKGADLLTPIMEELGPEFVLFYTSGLRERRNLELEDGVNLGSLDQAGVRQAYWDADALLFPTRLEGFPLVVLEAMACGLPVIGSNRSSMPEVVEDAETGLLCDLEVGAFVAEARRLRGDRNLRSRLSLSARSRVVRELSIEQTASRYVELFSALVK